MSLFRAVAAILTISLGVPAQAITWEYWYAAPNESGQINSCNAGVNYSDGPFIVRFYGDRVDFYLSDDEFALPSGGVLGTVDLRFGRQWFSATAEAGRSDTGGPVNFMFVNLPRQDLGRILDRLKADSRFDIVFPNGTSFEITLAGSRDAISRAYRCWSTNWTGTYSYEDETGGGSAAGNPFATW